MKIGFIGLGNMGAPMARNLAKAGHEVTGFDVNFEQQSAEENCLDSDTNSYGQRSAVAFELH